jgi:2-polyprenyl-6-hydroxyphenyl methylase/3-demethylubiquinone-9 3-methyltransferase
MPDAPPEEITFSFGANWRKYVKRALTPERLATARRSLADFLAPRKIEGKTFLDIGSGSGIFSYGALELGAARVVSFDVDPRSVACTRILRERAGRPERWQVLHGSVLDDAFLATIEPAEIVYSWGVLHHTGAMWRALANAAAKVAPQGCLYTALYSRHEKSEWWLGRKRLYNKKGRFGKWLMRARLAFRALREAQLAGTGIRAYLRSYDSGRGMSFWRDVEDWLGGLPYEYASVDEVEDFLRPRGFALARVARDPLWGCNEFLFERTAGRFAREAAPATWVPRGASGGLSRARCAFAAGEIAEVDLLAAVAAEAGEVPAAVDVAARADALAWKERPAEAARALAGWAAVARARRDAALRDATIAAIDARAERSSGGFGGLEPLAEAAFVLRSAYTAHALPPPFALGLVEYALGPRGAPRPVPEGATALLAEAHALARTRERTEHRRGEAADRLAAIGERALARLEAGPASADEAAALATAVAEVALVRPGWLGALPPVRSSLDVVPWI